MIEALARALTRELENPLDVVVACVLCAMKCSSIALAECVRGGRKAKPPARSVCSSVYFDPG